MQKSQKSNWYFNLSIYTFVIIGALIATGYQFPVGGNFPELPQIQHLLNPELYKNDYHVQEMVKFNPRYYYYHIIYFLASLGLSIPLVHFIYQFLAFGSVVLACHAIIKIYTKAKLPAAVLTFFMFNILIYRCGEHADIFYQIRTQYLCNGFRNLGNLL